MIYRIKNRYIQLFYLTKSKLIKILFREFFFFNQASNVELV
jgi:hypothetical protein